MNDVIKMYYPSHKTTLLFSAPICLPERGSDFLGQYGWAAGWGALSPGSRLRPRTLQAVDVPVLDNRVCERWHRANGELVFILKFLTLLFAYMYG